MEFSERKVAAEDQLRKIDITSPAMASRTNSPFTQSEVVPPYRRGADDDRS